MSKLKPIDFYFGAILSQTLIVGSRFNPSLIYDGSSKRVYSIFTDHHEYILSMHYRGKSTTTNNTITWTLSLSAVDVMELKENRNSGKRNIVAWILLDDKNKMSQSHVIFIADHHLSRRNVFSEDNLGVSLTIKKHQDKNDYILYSERKAMDDIPIKTTIMQALKCK